MAMAAAYRRSGLTAAEFAERHGIGVWRVRRWARERGPAESPVAKKPALAVRFAPVQVTGRTAVTGSVEVLVGGVVVRIGPDFDADLLRRVVEVLGGTGC
jgi:hypothetical protein